MLTKQDLTDALKTTEEKLTAKIESSRKEFNEGIETAVVQISKAVIKALDNVATKDDLKGVENRLGGVENRLDKVENSIQELKTEVMYVKGDVRDLKADSPTAIEFTDHEKRISRLEKATFPA